MRNTLLLLGSLSLLASCGDDSPPLRVGSVEFTEEDLLGLTDERRDRLVALTALGLATARDEVEAAGAPLLDRRREALVVDRFAADLVLETSGVEEDVLREQYLTNPRYELVVRHVVALADETAPDSVHRAAREKARRALQRLNEGEAMAEVAADLSEEPGAARRGGQLEPGRQGSWVPGFWEAANGLEEGAHTEVVQTEYGYHVIQLEERRVVPFEEVRSEAILRAGRMLGGMEEAWSRWSDSLSGTIRVDTAAVRVATEEGALDLAPLAFATSDTTPASPVLARWDTGAGEVGGNAPDAESSTEGRYLLADLLRHLASLEKGRWSEVTRDGAEALLPEIRRDALRKRAVQEARARGLRLSPGLVERTAREWRDRAASWAASLGFQPDASSDAVRARALDALSTTRQNASIARRELEAREPLLRAAYPVRAAQDS